MSTYHWSEDYVLDELDGAKGWVWFNWAIMSRASMFGTGMVIKGDGYVAQERKILNDKSR